MISLEQSDRIGRRLSSKGIIAPQALQMLPDASLKRSIICRYIIGLPENLPQELHSGFRSSIAQYLRPVRGWECQRATSRSSPKSKKPADGPNRHAGSIGFPIQGVAGNMRSGQGNAVPASSGLISGSFSNTSRITSESFLCRIPSRRSHSSSTTAPREELIRTAPFFSFSMKLPVDQVHRYCPLPPCSGEHEG